MISMFLVNLLVIRFGDERRPVGRLHPRVTVNRQDRISGSDRTRCSVVRESEAIGFGSEFPRETRALASEGSASSLAQPKGRSLFAETPNEPALPVRAL